MSIAISSVAARVLPVVAEVAKEVLPIALEAALRHASGPSADAGGAGGPPASVPPPAESLRQHVIGTMQSQLLAMVRGRIAGPR